MTSTGMVRDKDRDMLNVFEIIQTIRLRSILGSSQNIQDWHV